MRHGRARRAAFWLSTAAVAIFAACDTTTNPPPPPPPPPPVPEAVVEVSGNGKIEVHPSIDARFGAAIVFPIQLQETGGGTAIWNYFRVSYSRRGNEIERNEQGADAIQAAGHRDIGAHATLTAEVITRVNATDWDDVQIQLGFIDNKDARAFEKALTLDAFDGVVLDLTPEVLPDGSSFAIVERSGR